jgi:3-hydroxyisobutyrate dehydrogenase-like beta-hydroxyacid dehydrogenase
MKIAFIGFGEAAQAFVTGWQTRGPIDVSAYDLLPERRADCAALGVTAADSAVAAVAGADLVFSAVTADQVLQAADSILPAVRPGLLFLDINSAAPFRKAEAAARVAGGGAGTVDVAVMAPVHPLHHETPLLISGPGARDAAPLLEGLGMKFDLVSDRTGDASTVKMIRSVAIKGFESVTMECVTAAVKLGIDDQIIPSVGASLGLDFAKLADRVMERVVVHGKRRAAEMREVAATLEHAGVTSFLPAGTAAHQQTIADLDVRGRFDGAVPRDHKAIAHQVLKAIADKG